jgi:hypothetical protein
MRYLPGLVVGAMLLLTPTAPAWSNKEHIQLTRLAAQKLIADPDTPQAMKQWLTDNTPGLTDLAGEREYFMRARVGMFPRVPDGIAYWSTIPDMVALTDRPEKTVEPFGVHERLLHYLDVELFNPDDARRVYRHDLGGRPGIADIPRDMTDVRYKTAGMLPFRIEQAHGELVKAIRAGRFGDRPEQYPRDEHAARWAGYMAHYVADNTQPHHATIDYKSASYFSDARSAPNIHVEMEYRMCDDEADDHAALREEYWPLLVEALSAPYLQAERSAPPDPWVESVETSLEAYEGLPLIGLAAMHAAGQQGEPGDPQGPATRPAFSTEEFFRYRGKAWGSQMSVMQLKARQQALAVHRIVAAWRRAWDEASAR